MNTTYNGTMQQVKQYSQYDGSISQHPSNACDGSLFSGLLVTSPDIVSFSTIGLILDDLFQGAGIRIIRVVAVLSWVILVHSTFDDIGRAICDIQHEDKPHCHSGAVRNMKSGLSGFTRKEKCNSLTWPMKMKKHLFNL